VAVVVVRAARVSWSMTGAWKYDNLRRRVTFCDLRTRHILLVNSPRKRWIARSRGWKSLLPGP
jgi:hypothetical protein